MKHIDWSKPKDVDPASQVFPANVIGKFMPNAGDVPKEFWSDRNPWTSLASRWFCSGLPAGTSFKPREGVDRNKALVQLRACLGSFEPKHEHKEAAAGFLLSLFFESVDVPGVGVTK